MRENAIFHEPESRYCFAAGKDTIRLRIRIAKEDNPTKVEVIYGGKYDFASKQMNKKMEVIAIDKLYKYYGVTLTLADLRLVYIFKFTVDNQVLFYSEDGLSDTYDFMFNYYNCFQYAYINKADIHELIEGCEKAVFYQIFIDRFRIGLRHNKEYINLKWNNIPDSKSFAGGDLCGIIEKLDYIKSLGVNYIYLTPVFKSISNHKYDIKDYYIVDEMFGGNEYLSKLVSEAHKKNMKVVLDAVFNHCSEENLLFLDVKKNKKNSKYYDWFIITNDDPLEYECFSSCKYMPKFNTSNDEVCDYLIGVAKYWTKELSLDGWRLDVSDEVSHHFWRKFRDEIKKINKNCILIGENWHDANSYLRGDQFDSIMNYAITKACLDFFAFNLLNAKEFVEKLNSLLMRNTDNVNNMMLNLLDSHDTFRFLTRVNENTEKLMSAIALIYFYPGMPCIYYGTENNMIGNYDPDSRRTFDWNLEKVDNPVKTLIRKLSLLRQEGELMGDFKLYSEKGFVILEKISKENIYRLIINGNDEVKKYCSDNITMSSGECLHSIKPFGFIIEKIRGDKCD